MYEGGYVCITTVNDLADEASDFVAIALSLRFKLARYWPVGKF